MTLAPAPVTVPIAREPACVGDAAGIARHGRDRVASQVEGEVAARTVQREAVGGNCRRLRYGADASENHAIDNTDAAFWRTRGRRDRADVKSVVIAPAQCAGATIDNQRVIARRLRRNTGGGEREIGTDRCVFADNVHVRRGRLDRGRGVA